ncbi:MAG: ABC transporter permease [Oscillospiraceae bacterium]|nr:ABC transporter permease [Oscillospiraceae bacterium]
MTQLRALCRRNCKLFFKDKGMFITSLITPMILLVLYISFLGKVYRDAFASTMPAGFLIDSSVIDGMVGGQLLSSLLAVCCVTVSFCSNLLMVQDKVTGARLDLDVSPVSSQILALSYFLSTFAVTTFICLLALGAGLIYLAVVGWYLRLGDILLLLCDVIVTVLFGTALSSMINSRLSTNGQASAVGTIVSSGYGFICGAYMPISNFGEGLQKVISFLPGTYGTSLFRNHAMAGSFAEMARLGLPAEVISSIRDAVDCNLYFFGEQVSMGAMWAIMLLTVAILTGIYVLMCRKSH